MDSVIQISEPGFQGGRVVFADHGAIGDDVGFAADGSPLPRRIKEGDVDFGVGFQVIGLARFGIGMEYQIYAVALLLSNS